jgi:Zn-finger domain-containing protein
MEIFISLIITWEKILYSWLTSQNFTSASAEKFVHENLIPFKTFQKVWDKNVPLPNLPTKHRLINRPQFSPQVTNEMPTH